MYWALRMGKNTNTLVDNNVMNVFKNQTKQRKIVLEYSFELIFCKETILRNCIMNNFHKFKRDITSI